MLVLLCFWELKKCPIFSWRKNSKWTYYTNMAKDHQLLWFFFCFCFLFFLYNVSIQLQCQKYFLIQIVQNPFLWRNTYLIKMLCQQHVKSTLFLGAGGSVTGTFNEILVPRKEFKRLKCEKWVKILAWE